MLTITPSALCISDSQQEFTLFNNAAKKVYVKISSSNMTSYAYPTQVFEIASMQQHQFTIKILLDREASLTDRLIVNYDFTADMATPRMLQISLTASAITLDSVQKYGYQLDYHQLLEERARLKKEINAASLGCYNVEAEGMQLESQERQLDSEITSLNVALGRELKDWKMRVRRAVMALQNQSFWFLMFLVGFLIGIKW